MLRQTVYFGQQLADSDVLSLEQFAQKDLALFILDAFGGGTSPFYAGLAVIPGSDNLLDLGIGAGRVYKGLPEDGTPWGSISHGISADATTVLKFGSNDALLDNYQDPTNLFVSPGAGSNYYLLEATLLEEDTNLELLTFTDTAGIYTTQYMYQNRVVAIQFKVKGPSTVSTPTVDAGYVGVAAITIPSGVTQMLAGYINQAPYPAFTGFATVSAGGGFVHLSPGSPDIGFVSITGAYETAAGEIDFNNANGGLLVSAATATNPAFTFQNSVGGFGGDLLDIYLGASLVFKIPFSGILPVLYGGSGNSAPSLLAGYGISITGAWPNQIITFAPSTPITIADGGTGTATPGMTAGVGIAITGTWPNNTISFAPGLPLPIVFGGTGQSSPALTAGAGIAITGVWPNNNIARLNNQIGDTVPVQGSTPANVSHGSGPISSTSIVLPPGTWLVRLMWNTSGLSVTTYITLSAGTVTSQSASSQGSGGSGGTSCGALFVCQAVGGQTLHFTFNITSTGGGSVVNPGAYTLDAIRIL